MSEFLKMDIFFVVTTLCVVVIAGLAAYAIWKIIRILKHVEHIAEVAEHEVDNLREDAAYVRGRAIGALDALFSFIPRKRRARPASAHEKKETGDAADAS